MRRGLAAVLSTLALLAGCSGEPEPPKGPPSPALWEVTGPNGAHGWLFGTVHALPDGYDWGTAALAEAFASSETLAVEVDLETDDPDYYEKLKTTPGLGRPSSRVDPAYREGVVAAFAKAGRSEDDYLDTETWAVVLALSAAFSIGESENGVDAALLAGRGSKPMVELEGDEAQLAIFDRLPLEEQLDMLEIVAAEADTDPAERLKLVRAWRTGNTAVIEAEMETGFLADPELREALGTGRNRAMAVRIDRLLKGGTDLFVAVGTAHMLGEDGLTALLTRQGYTVKRVQ